MKSYFVEVLLEKIPHQRRLHAHLILELSSHNQHDLFHKHTIEESIHSENINLLNISVVLIFAVNLIFYDKMYELA